MPWSWASAMRFSGLDSSEVSPAAVLLASGLVMVLNVLPVPGLNALIVPQLSSILGITSETQAVAADGRPHAVPGGHVDHAHDHRLRDVLRLALPGSQGHRDHGQP